MSEQSMTRVRAPSAATVRKQIEHFWELWRGAMFLKREIYTYERDQKNPFGSGLLYIAVIGILIALAGILGAGLRYATLPNADAIKNVLLTNVEAMPFFSTLDLNSQAQFERTANQLWSQVAPLVLGYPISDTGFAQLIASVVTTPLGLIIGWLLYGALVHLIARGWHPETLFAEMLAPLAMATSPALLNVILLFPIGGVFGLTIPLWTFICNVFAIRIAYQTTSGRAIWAALFPILLLFILLIVAIILALLLVLPVSRTGGPQ